MTPLLMALEALSRMLENPHNEMNQEYAKYVLLINGQDVPTQNKDLSTTESFDAEGCPICCDIGLLPGNDIPCTCQAGKAYS